MAGTLEAERNESQKKLQLAQGAEQRGHGALEIITLMIMRLSVVLSIIYLCEVPGNM